MSDAETPQPTATTAEPAAPAATPAVKRAGVGRRAVAVIIDTILLFFGLGYGIAILTGQYHHSTSGSIGFKLHGAPALLWFAISLAYFVVLEKTIGATLGKLMLGLRVRTLDGGAITWKASIVRNVMRIVDGFGFYLVGAIVAWTSDLRQRVGDKLAKTVVV